MAGFSQPQSGIPGEEAGSLHRSVLRQTRRSDERAYPQIEICQYVRETLFALNATARRFWLPRRSKEAEFFFIVRYVDLEFALPSAILVTELRAQRRVPGDWRGACDKTVPS